MTHHPLSQSVFQSTPPWGGELVKRCNGVPVIFVSIHAPVGGRTSARSGHDTHSKVSIHAPVGGRTLPFVFRLMRPCLFQSTPPWGGEPVIRNGISWYRIVSIHAPVGGRTNRCRAPSPHRACFNPRPRGGANLDNAPKPFCPICFNPRPRGGANLETRIQPLLADLVSIHAPVGGRTFSELEPIFLSVAFQSTPPWGGERWTSPFRV